MVVITPQRPIPGLDLRRPAVVGSIYQAAGPDIPASLEAFCTVARSARGCRLSSAQVRRCNAK
jgi:hypothetical protein